jgi:excisionase family DNA binding protein
MAKSNPLKKWRTVAQVAEQCGVTSQAIRDAIKAGKIEGWPVGENLLIHKDQVPLFEKTRLRKIRQIGDGKFKVDYLPARGRRKASHQSPNGGDERVLDHAKA